MLGISNMMHWMEKELFIRKMEILLLESGKITLLFARFHNDFCILFYLKKKFNLKNTKKIKISKFFNMSDQYVKI